MCEYVSAVLKFAHVSDSLALALRRAVRAERARHGWSQSELANRLNWSQQKIAAIEGGTRRLYADELSDVCKALGLPLRDLLSRADAADRLALGL
jgi:transcriptional regulator with XRE-family HTH domain